MLEITVTINCPDLLKAAELLSAALTHRTQNPKPSTMPAAPAAPESLPVVPAVTVPQEVPTAPAPVAPTAPTYPVASVPPTAPVSATVVPVAPAPGITLEQLATAGAELIRADRNKHAALMTLLQQFGVRSVMDLSPDKIGAFATAMRGLGANI